MHRVLELPGHLVAAERAAVVPGLFERAVAAESMQPRRDPSGLTAVATARGKVDSLRARLADLRRMELLPRDSRICPGHYAPVMVWEQGRRVVKPMRYQCRPAGKPAAYDAKYPGTYNARRDNLRGFWGRAGRRRVSAICCRLQPSPTSRRRARPMHRLAAAACPRCLAEPGRSGPRCGGGAAGRAGAAPVRAPAGRVRRWSGWRDDPRRSRKATARSADGPNPPPPSSPPGTPPAAQPGRS